MAARCLAFALLLTCSAVSCSWLLPKSMSPVGLSSQTIPVGSCPRVPSRLFDPPSASLQSSCLAHAARWQPDSVIQLTNGSCLMIGGCSTPVAPANIFPLYALIPPHKAMLLLRTRAETNSAPYQLLWNGTDNSSLSTDDLVGTAPFRSPLLSAHPTLFSRIQLVLANESTAPQVNLTFKMDAAMRITDEGAWFSRARLVASHPWDISLLKSESFRHFSMAGYDDRARFLMTTSEMGASSCNEISGYIMVLESRFLDCGLNNQESAYYWVAEDAPASSLFITGTFGSFQHRQHSSEFRLYGELVSGVRWYQRL